MLSQDAANAPGSGRPRIHHRKSASDTFAWAASAALTDFAAMAPLAGAPHGLTTGAERSAADRAPIIPAIIGGVVASTAALEAPTGAPQAEVLLETFQRWCNEVDPGEDVEVEDLELDAETEEGEHLHDLVPPAALEAGRGGLGVTDAGPGARPSSVCQPGLAAVPPPPVSPATAAAATPAVGGISIAPLLSQEQEQQHLGGDGGRGGLHRRAVSCTAGSGGGGRRGQGASTAATAAGTTTHPRHSRNPSDSLLLSPTLAPALDAPPPPPAVQLVPMQPVLDKPLSEFAGQTRANAFDPSQLDPKRAKRIIANRQSAHRSRMKKLQLIHELEGQVAAAQAAADATRAAVAAAAGRRRELLVAAAEAHCGLAALRRELAEAEAAQAAMVAEINALGIPLPEAPLGPQPPTHAGEDARSIAGMQWLAGGAPMAELDSLPALTRTTGSAGPPAVKRWLSCTSPPLDEPDRPLTSGPEAVCPAGHSLQSLPSASRGRAAAGSASFSCGGASPGALAALPPLPPPVPLLLSSKAQQHGHTGPHRSAPGQQLQVPLGIGSSLLPEPTLSPQGLGDPRRSADGAILAVPLTAGSDGGGQLGPPVLASAPVSTLGHDGAQALDARGADAVFRGASSLASICTNAASGACSLLPAPPASHAAAAAPAGLGSVAISCLAAATAPAAGQVLFAFPQPAAAPPKQLQSQAGGAPIILRHQQQAQHPPPQPQQPGQQQAPRRRQVGPQHLHRRHMSAGCAADMDRRSWDLLGAEVHDTAVRTTTITTAAATAAPDGGAGGGVREVGGRGGVNGRLFAGSAHGGAGLPVPACASGGGGAANLAAVPAAVLVGPSSGDMEMAPAVAVDPLAVDPPPQLLQDWLSSNPSAAMVTTFGPVVAAAEAGAAPPASACGPTPALGYTLSLNQPELPGPNDAATAVSAGPVPSAMGEGGAAAVAAGFGGGEGEVEGCSPMAVDGVGGLGQPDEEGSLMPDAVSFLKEEPGMDDWAAAIGCANPGVLEWLQGA